MLVPRTCSIWLLDPLQNTLAWASKTLEAHGLHGNNSTAHRTTSAAIVQMAQNASVTSLPSITPAPSPANPPPFAALFLVVFDHRKGYVLQWQRSLPGVEVEGVVEFKSLPSGLHHVEEDLIYFVHENYAGVSAYINKPDAASERNASMLAVGMLVPLEHGRMGKSWLHAEHLKKLAEEQIKNVKATDGLEEYWEDHNIDENTAPKLPEESTDTLIHDTNGQVNGYHKSRAMSTGSVFLPGGHSLAPHHPATTLMDMLSVFGPLIFPLYRAALLRKRILLVIEAPVEFACDVVYNLSVLSSLPRHLAVYLPKSDASRRRIPSLFNVGIQDIDLLSKSTMEGWVACTTDDVLATKPELFDLAVFMPGKESKQARRKVYPKLVPSSTELAKQFPKVGVRASQRDAVRYEGLVSGIRPYPRSEVISPVHDDGEQQEQAETRVEDEELDVGEESAYSSRAPSIHEHREIVEPPSWSQVAYTSLLWWASAGDRINGLSEEEETEMERDAMLLDTGEGEDGTTKEVVVVGYFRRLTGMMFQAVSEVLQQEEEAAIEEDNEGARDGVSEQQPEPEHAQEHHREESFDQGSDVQRPLIPRNDRSEVNDGEDDIVEFTAEDVSAMGLDVWSRGDRDFVGELLEGWWKRRARVRAGRVECCGVRIL